MSRSIEAASPAAAPCWGVSPSVSAAGACRRLGRLGRGRRRGARRPGLAGGAVEILEELRIRAQQKPGIARLERPLISLHRAVEGEEVRILAEGLGKDAVLLGIAIAPDALRFAGRVGLDHGDFAIGGAADTPRGTLAFGAELGRLPLPLGLHAAVDRLHVRFRQVDALDAHINDIDAKGSCFLVDLTEDGAHQLLALVAHHGRKARGTEDAPERGLQEGPLAASWRPAHWLRSGRRAMD